LSSAWTLRYEWIFYCSLPFLGWFTKGKLRLLLIISFAAAISFAINHLHFVGNAHALANIVETYAHFLAYTFSAGMLVASIPVSEKLRKIACGKIASFLSIATLLTVIFFIPPEFGWIESSCLLMPFALICWGNNWFGFLSSASLRFLGRISYSVYLLHILVITIGLKITGLFTNINTLSAISYWMLISIYGVFAIFISAFSYQWFESPFLHVGRVQPSVIAPAPECQNPEQCGPTTVIAQ